jgi:hypothetical protein
VAEHARVVVVGGFGGLWAARALAGGPVDVFLIDRCNYHTFLPLMYQVAAAELEPEDIAYPIRSALSKLPAVRFMMTDVRAVRRRYMRELAGKKALLGELVTHARRGKLTLVYGAHDTVHNQAVVIREVLGRDVSRLAQE